MTSVVITARNEAAVLGRCLDSLLADAEPGEFDIVVVANGCTDDTARVAAARRGVRVIDRVEPGKAGALNVGDAVARGFPRLYLDADVVLTSADLREMAVAVRAAAAGGAGVLAAAPRRELDVTGSPLAVRAFYAINSRLPVYRDGLFGRGVIALAEQGRARFTEFPNLVADDLFLDSLFTATEKCQVNQVTARVCAPRTTRDLIRRLIRVRAGNAAMRAAAGSAAAPATVRRAARLSWLSDVVLPRPWLLPAALCYVTLTLIASHRARQVKDVPTAWGRDESSRRVVAASISGDGHAG